MQEPLRRKNNMDNTSFRIIPKYQEEQFRKSSFCNFSLYSPRMVSWEKKDDSKKKFQLYTGEEKEERKDINGKTKVSWVKKNDDAKEELCKKGNEFYKSINSFLDIKQAKQFSYLDSLKKLGMQTFTIKAKTTSPFITGLGSGHPTETGMILDRNIGVPYIPASSIKGVLRLAYAINIAKGRKEVSDLELERYFGTADAKQEKQFRGQLVLLDAYPTKDVQLKVDIMNPHYTKYYDGTNKQPVETESPVPIKFLTVKEGTEFCFNCAFMPLELNDKCNEDEINAMFTTAFERVGFGGKTAIGYGRFVKVDGKFNDVEQNNIQKQLVKEVKTLEAGEYKATVNNVDKNRQSIYFEIDKTKEKAVIRNCKQKDYAMYPKKAKVKIKLDGTKNSQDDYIVIEIIEKL